MSNEELADWSTNERIDTWFGHMKYALDFLDSPEFKRGVEHHRVAGGNSVGSEFDRIARNGHVVRRAVACNDMDRSGFSVSAALYEEAATMRAVCDRHAAQIKNDPTHLATQTHIINVIECFATTPQLQIELPSMEIRALIARSAGGSLNEKITNHISEEFERQTLNTTTNAAMSVAALRQCEAHVAELKKTEESIKADVATATDAAEAAKAAVGKSAANVHARRHKELAKEEFQRADDSMYAAGFVVIVILTGAIITMLLTTPPNTALGGIAGVSEMIRVYGSRLTALSVLLYGLSVFVRNYRAHTHNALVHEHRAAVFDTFEAFIKSAPDDAVKSLVLTQTLQLVLAQQPTGFLPTEPEPTPAAQAADLIEKVSKIKGG